MTKSQLTAASQHTPGPWFADKLQDQNAYNVFPSGATHALVTVSASAGAPLSHSVAVAANARLIAAAPDLLDALQTAYMAVCNWIPTNAGGRLAKDNALAKIDAAIAKATGA